MHNALGLFGLVCGAIVVWTVGSYGYASADIPAVKWNMAFLFGAIACGGLFGHAVAVRVWLTSKPWALAIGLTCGIALIVNLGNSLGALAGRSDNTTIERLALNKRIRSDETELTRLRRQYDAMPPFLTTDAAAVLAAKRSADTATDNRKAECGNGDPRQRGRNCRAREIEEKNAADTLASVTAAKAATDLAVRREADIAVLRERLAKVGPLVTVNVQGSALARLFRLPDTEADFAATVQQFGMAVIVELLIVCALAARELLPPQPSGSILPSDMVTAAENRGRAPPNGAVSAPAASAAAPARFATAPKPHIVSSHAPRGSVNDYVVARLEVAKGRRIEFSALYTDYETWCGTQNCGPLTPEQFAEAMKRICEGAKVRIEPIGTTAVFIGIKFSDVAADRAPWTGPTAVQGVAGA